MEKSSIQRDLEDWEFLTDEGFLEIPLPDPSKSSVITRELGFGGRRGLVDVNYFVCPPHPPHLLVAAAQDLIPPIKGEKVQDEEIVKEIREVENQEVISQVFFRKLGENEFVDMKLDSPTSKPPLMEVPRYEEDKREKVEEEEEEEEREEGGGEEEKDLLVGAGMNAKNNWESFGFGIWKWKIAGFGAICSIGVAAATIFIFVLSGNQRQMQQQRQKIQFQIYPDEKSIKQVVQQATRLNQAISVVRGVPRTRAHISFGGYYDGL